MVIKMDYKVTTNSEEDTIVLAQNFESEKFNNMVICLIGDLGSGKTVFTKGFASALGIEENITSPTFNITAIIILTILCIKPLPIILNVNKVSVTSKVNDSIVLMVFFII